MSSRQRVIYAWTDDLKLFVRARDVKFLYANIGPDLRMQALNEVNDAERNADNRSPFFIFEQVHLGTKQEWPKRSDQLAADYKKRAMVLEKRGKPQKKVVVPVDPKALPLAIFAGVLAQVAGAIPAPLSGMVVVLAPMFVEKLDAWAADVRNLIEAPGLKDLRWIVLESTPSPLREFAAQLDSRQ